MVRNEEQGPLHSRILSGSAVLLTGSGLTMALSLGYNLVIARRLGARGFGLATALYTVLVVLSALTLAFQIVAAKLIARQSTVEGKWAAYRHVHRLSWISGLLAGGSLVAFAAPVAHYLRMPGPALIDIVALGAAFYVPLGARRGFIQGECGYRGFAFNLTLEQAVRFGGSFALVLAGCGLTGVIAANSAAVVICYFALPVRVTAPVQLTDRDANPISVRDVGKELTQAAIFFAGQMLITNSGMVLAKHYFLAQQAGLFAAVATVGRVVFSLSQAVVNTAFPLVAAAAPENRNDLRMIATCLGLVVALGAPVSLALWLMPASVWPHVLGAGFASLDGYGTSQLMAIYSLAIVIYAMASVVVTFELAHRISHISWVQLAFSGVLVGGIARCHASLKDLTLMHLMVMTVFFIVVSVPLLYREYGAPAYRLTRRLAGLART